MFQLLKVGVCTGSFGVLVRQHFFDESIFNASDGPMGGMLVDDKWTHAHLAKRNIPRFVVPSVLDHTHLGVHNSAIDSQVKKHSEVVGRTALSTAVIEYFKPYWDTNLLYDRCNWNTLPKWRWWLTFGHKFGDVALTVNRWLDTENWRTWRHDISPKLLLEQCGYE